MSKRIVKFANTTNTSGETISELDQSPMSVDRSIYNRMNVVVKINTLTGTNPTLTVSIQENFGGIYVETAKSTALGSASAWILTRDVGNTTGVTSVFQAGFPALGSGADKKVVTTIGGTTSVVNADIYFVFFDTN